MSDPHRGKVSGKGGTNEASDEEHRGPVTAALHPSDIIMSDPCPADILMSDPQRGWVTKSSREKVPGKGTTGAEVSGRERPVEVPNGEKETKPSCATPDCAGDAGTRSSYKEKVGEGDTDEASDEEHRGAVTAAIPHPSDIIMSDPHRGKVPGEGGTDEASDEEHQGPVTTP